MIASITRSLAIAGLLLAHSASAEEFEYKNARVITDAFPVDSIAGLAGQVSNNRFLRSGTVGNRQYGEVSVTMGEISHFFGAIGDKKRQLAKRNRDRYLESDTRSLRSTLILESTEPHMDMKVSGNEFDEGDEVMFVFLETNEGAYFQIGDDKIPAKKGNMVKFNGHRVLHNTIVPSGTELRLLGPIDSRDLCAVGVCCPEPDPPTSAPTHHLEGAINHVLDFLIGILLGHTEDELLDPAAQSDILEQLSSGPLAELLSPNDNMMSGGGVPTVIVALVASCGVDLDDLTMPDPSAVACLQGAFGMSAAAAGDLEGIEALGDMSMSMP